MRINLFRRRRVERRVLTLPAELARRPRSGRDTSTYWRHYATNPIVHAAVSEIVHSVIGLPWVGQAYDPKRRIWADVGEEHPLTRFLARPNPVLSPVALWERFWTETIIAGNGLLWKQRSREGKIVALWPVDSRYVWIDPGASIVEAYIFDPQVVFGTGARMRSFTPPKDAMRFPAADMIHLRVNVDPEQPLWGLSSIGAAIDAIDLDNAITEFSTSLMERGAVPSYALTTKEPIDDEEVARITRRWERRHAGPSHAGELIVLDGTQGELTRMGLAVGSREMGLMDLRKQTEARILSALNVPPIVVGAVVGLENATYSNYAQARLALHEETTDPMLQRAASVLTFALAPEFGEGLRITPDTRRVMALEEWEDSRRRRTIAEFTGGLATQNEARSALGRGPVAGGDITLLPLNMTPVPANVGEAAPASGRTLKRLAAALTNPDPEAAWKVVRDEVTRVYQEAARNLGTIPDVRLNVMEYLRHTTPLRRDGESAAAAARRLAHAVAVATTEAVMYHLDKTERNS